MNGDYSDIINLEHHKSENYPWMPEEDRAAQFAPFAALVGFDEVIRKTAQQHLSRMEAKRGSEFD
jgi:hypothetical protein